MGRKRALRGDECVGCRARVREDGEELVAAVVHDDACPALDGLVKEAPVRIEDVRVAVAQLLHELR